MGRRSSWNERGGLTFDAGITSADFQHSGKKPSLRHALKTTFQLGGQPSKLLLPSQVVRVIEMHKRSFIFVYAKMAEQIVMPFEGLTHMG